MASNPCIVVLVNTESGVKTITYIGSVGYMYASLFLF